MYLEGRGKISNLKNSSLHVSMGLRPNIILIILLFSLKFAVLFGEFPQNSKP
jgi:hypothetical protein